MILAHPLGHLLFGERLYYLLVNVHTDLFGVREILCATLRDAALYNSSCAYMVFGESDILVRVWAQERRFREFLQDLNKKLAQHPPGQVQVRSYLITTSSTWYEKHIETQPSWPAHRLYHALEKCLETGRIDECFVYRSAGGDAEATKLFVFIEQPAVRARDVFREMCERVNSGRLEDLERVSLYQYRSTERRGVLMKAEAANFRKASVSLVKLARDLKQPDFSANTTTYVCAESLKDEESVPSKESIDLVDPVKFAYNLLISHDCNEGRFTDSHGRFTDELAHNHSDQFKKLVAERYPGLFLLMANRPDFTEKLRSMYRWTVRREEQNLRRYLIDFYIELEAMSRDLFESSEIRIGGKNSGRKILEIARRVLPEEHYAKLSEAAAPRLEIEEAPKQFTLGNLVDCIRWVKSKLPDCSKYPELDQFREVLSPQSESAVGLIRNRNDLMHGNTVRLFRGEGGGASDLWVTFVRNYLDAELLRPRLFEAFGEALKSSG